MAMAWDCGAAAWNPRQRTDQSWKVRSFLEDARLENRVVFNLDFDRSKASPRYGTLWLATSDGLREYDGYVWRRHGQERGLPSDFVRSVLVTRTGVLWVGTDRGAGVYDGETFRSLGSETGLAGPNVRRMVEDSDGTIWFCCDSWPNAGTPGGLTAYRDGVWTSYGRADGLPSDYVMNFFRSRTGRAFAATMGGVVELRDGVWVPTVQTPPNPRYNWGAVSFAEPDEPGLVCSTGQQVFTADGEGWRMESASLSHKHAMVATGDGRLVAVGLSDYQRGVFVEWRSNDWTRVSSVFRVPDGFVIDVREAPDGSVWAMGSGCLVRWSRRGGQWSEFPGLPDPRVVDAHGGLWFLRRPAASGLGAEPVRFRAGEWERKGELANGVVVDRVGAVWGWSADQVTRWSEGQATRSFTVGDVGLATNRVLEVDHAGGIWVVGSDATGVPAISGFDGEVWRSRLLEDWKDRRVWDPVEPGRDGVWVVADEGQMTDATLRYVGRTGGEEEGILIPKRIVDVYRPNFLVDGRGTAWLFGGTGLHRWQIGSSKTWEAIGGLPGQNVMSCVERGQELWFACTGRTGGGSGLARLREGRWTVFPVETQGVLVLAHDGSLLWPADGRFYHLADEAGAMPVAVDLPVNAAVRAVLKDRDGAYWVSAGTGVFRFRTDGAAPETRVVGPDRITHGDLVEARAEGIERFQNRRTRADQRFSWRLDGGEWTPPARQTYRAVATEGLSVGLHRLEVRCADSGGEVDSTPASLDFDVLPLPLQRRAWFLPMLGGAVTILLGLTGVTIRTRQKLAENVRVLEKRVRERTAELTRDMAQRRAAESEAKEGRERFMKVFQASPSLVGITSYPDGRFFDANRCFVETLGYELKDVMGRTGTEVGIWVDAEERDSMYAALESQGLIRNRELRIRAKSGQLHTVLASVERIDFGGRPSLLFAAADITDRVRMERRRATEHAVARVLADATSLAEAIPAVLKAICESEDWTMAELWEVEPSAGRLKRVVVWHAPDERLAEMAKSDTAPTFGLGEGLPGFVWKAPGPVFIADLSKDLRFWRNAAAARAGLRAGLGFPIRAGGQVTGVLVMFTDHAVWPGQDFEELLGAIGSQVGQFIARSRARAELERFVAMSPTVLYVLKPGPTGLEPTWVSPTLEVMTGYGSEESMTPRWWAENLHPDDRRRVMESQSVPYETDHLVLEFRFRCKDGTFIWLRDEKRLVRDAAGRPMEVVGTWSDISERMALEARLIQAQKMEAIGLLSGGIAHDFNNMLGAILGNAQLAQMDVPADHPAAESLEAILQATRRAKAVVRQILDFARQEARELRHIPLGPVVDESVRLLRVTLPSEVDVVFLGEADLPCVAADASQIQQAVLNLGTNAWHALEDRPGRIEVSLSRVEMDEATASLHPDLRMSVYVRLRVQDTGAGMSQETLEKIFMPFFTTKAPGTGTGLGLSVVHGIVKAHGGAVLVSSTPGAGSIFDLYFPVATEPVRDVASQPRAETPTGRNERILLVDDKELIVRACSRALGRLGYQVTSFTDGPTAMAEIHSRCNEFDLVLTDLSMPGISGLEIARFVLQLRPDLPVVLSSGMVPEEMQQELAAAGVRDVLRKPFTFEELGETVARALSRRLHEHPVP